MQYLVTFYTHFDAIEYKRFLKKQKGIEARLQPVPRKISSSCGTCVVFSLDSGMDDFNAFVNEDCAEIFLLSDTISKIYPTN